MTSNSVNSGFFFILAILTRWALPLGPVFFFVCVCDATWVHFGDTEGPERLGINQQGSWVQGCNGIARQDNVSISSMTIASEYGRPGMKSSSVEDRKEPGVPMQCRPCSHHCNLCHIVIYQPSLHSRCISWAVVGSVV